MVSSSLHSIDDDVRCHVLIHTVCTNSCTEHDLMPEAFRLPVVYDFLDLFSQSAPVIHAPLFQSDEGRFHPLSAQCRHYLRKFQLDCSIHLLPVDLRVCLSLHAKKRQSALMHFEVENAHTPFS